MRHSLRTRTFNDLDVLPPGRSACPLLKGKQTQIVEAYERLKPALTMPLLDMTESRQALGVYFWSLLSISESTTALMAQSDVTMIALIL